MKMIVPISKIKQFLPLVPGFTDEYFLKVEIIFSKTKILVILMLMVVVAVTAIILINTEYFICRSAITCHWWCDSVTEYHQIKGSNLRLSQIVLNRA